MVILVSLNIICCYCEHFLKNTQSLKMNFMTALVNEEAFYSQIGDLGAPPS